jgi:DNA-binding XRE family transcriptional regulator
MKTSCCAQRTPSWNLPTELSLCGATMRVARIGLPGPACPYAKVQGLESGCNPYAIKRQHPGCPTRRCRVVRARRQYPGGFRRIHTSLKDVQLAKALGGVLRSIRLETGLSQAALAHRCGLQRAAVAAIERGERAITVETAHRISAALGLKLVEAFQRLEDSQAL